MKKLQKQCALGALVSGALLLGAMPVGAAPETKNLKAEKPAFDELIPWESDDLTISISSDDADLSDGYTLKLKAVNEAKEDIAGTLSETAVNHFMCETDDQGIVSWAVPAGQELDTQIKVSNATTYIEF